MNKPFSPAAAAAADSPTAAKSAAGVAGCKPALVAGCKPALPASSPASFFWKNSLSLLCFSLGLELGVLLLPSSVSDFVSVCRCVCASFL